jgi:hypothetical protein
MNFAVAFMTAIPNLIALQQQQVAIRMTPAIPQIT